MPLQFLGFDASSGSAISSAIQLADLALTWSNISFDADVSLIDLDLASDRGLVTAMLLSLFTDRRAAADDVPPSGNVQDRRGWWADEFAAVAGDLYGSRLWLLARSQNSNEAALLVVEYVNEALQWMLDDLVVSAIDVTTQQTSQSLQFAVAVSRPGRDPVSFRFAHTWDNLQGDLNVGA